MSIKITIENVEQCYELLRTTPPFKRWKLPSADHVIIHIVGSKRIFGCVDRRLDRAFILKISQPNHQTLESLLRTVGHEMVHMREYLAGGRADVAHGSKFHALADKVCKFHQWDRGVF